MQAALQYFKEVIPNGDLRLLKDTDRMKRMIQGNYTAQVLFEYIQSHAWGRVCGAPLQQQEGGDHTGDGANQPPAALST